MAGYWERKMISRRRILQAGALGGSGLALATLMGCGGSDDNGGATSGGAPVNTGSVSSSETGEELKERFHSKRLKDLPGQKDGPKYGGIHRRVAQNPPSSWDLTGAAAANLGFFGYFQSTLMALEVNDFAKDLHAYNFEPMLAKSWERSGNTTMIIKLDPAAKWHNVAPVNGRPFTSEDVAFAIEAYKKAPIQQFIYRDVDKVETPDKNTVRLSLKQPAAYLEQQLTTAYNLMFAREHAESPDGLAKRPIGTGPFIWESQQDRVGMKMRKNPEYWRKDPRTGMQLPYLDGIETFVFPDTSASTAAFHSKQLDGIGGGDRATWESILDGHPNYVSQIAPPQPGNQPSMAVRLDKEPWNDVRLRRALSMSIEREKIAAAFGQLGTPSYSQDWSFFGLDRPWTLEQLGPYQKFDPQQAKQLMSAAGFANGMGRKPAMLLSTNTGVLGYDIPLLVIDSWRRNLGFEVDVQIAADNATWNRAFFGKNYAEMAAPTYYTLGFEPDEMSYGINHSQAPSNFAFVNDRTMDDLVVKQGNELDKKERVKILRQIMDRDLDQQFHIWTVAVYQISVRQPHIYSYTATMYGGPTTVSSHGSQYTWLNTV